MQLTKKNLLALLSIATRISASTTCDPIEQDNCPADPALATGFAENFHSQSKWFKELVDPDQITYGDNGLALTLSKRGQAPTIESNFYIMFGKIEVELKAANGTGIVSSVVLLSDDKDEIDIELLGGDKTQFQTNYFSKGNTETYNRGQFEGVYAPQDVFHNYTVDWCVDKLTWYLDGNPVRVLENTTSQGYPQTPMVLKMGIWAGGDPSNAPGTIEWAGGLTDYNDAPFTMYVRRVIVTDYSTGKQYSYSNKSGSWESIVAEDGEINGRYSEALQEFAELAGSTGNSDDDDSSSSSSLSSSSSVTTSTMSTSSQTENSSSTVSLSESDTSSFSTSTATATTSTASVSNTTFTGSGDDSSVASTFTSSSSSSSSYLSSTGIITSTLSRNSTSTESITTSKTDFRKDNDDDNKNKNRSKSDDRTTSTTTTHEIAQTHNRAIRHTVPFDPMIFCLITLLNFI